MIIYLDKNFIVRNGLNPNIKRYPLNITEEQWKQICITPEFKLWQYTPETDTFNLVDDLSSQTLRYRRERECFSRLDSKSKFWWDALTEEETIDLKKWYLAWLDVTLTLTIPELPKIFNTKEVIE